MRIYPQTALVPSVQFPSFLLKPKNLKITCPPPFFGGFIVIEIRAAVPLEPIKFR